MKIFSFLKRNKESEGSSHIRFRLLTIFSGLFLIGFFLWVITFLFVVFAPNNSVGTSLRKIFPAPIAMVGWSTLSYQTLDFNRDSLRHFYESQAEDIAKTGFRIDFGTEEGKKRLIIREKNILNALVQDRVIKILAERRGIRITDKEVRDGIDEAIAEGGGELSVLETRLRDLYGWSVKDFGEYVVRPSLYRERLENAFNAERDTKTAKENIEKASLALAAGDSFEAVATRFSEGDSAKNEGDLGWVSVEDLVPELQERAKEQDIGRYSTIIESTLGYHIILVVERNQQDEGDVSLHLKQIFTRKPSFADWIVEETKKQNILLFSRQYLQEETSGEIIFRDKAMREFERSALEATDGDPSLIF